MGKLNIAHHKSYHPYRRDNIDKVRRDEEEAALKEASADGRIMLADSEARMDLLRQKAGLAKSKRKRRGDSPELTEGGKLQLESLPTTGGHINLFEDLEQTRSIASASKQAAPKARETERGVALGPSVKDLKPWYSVKNDEQTDVDLKEKRRRDRDVSRKSRNDPLASVTKELSARPSSDSSTSKRDRGSYGPRGNLHQSPPTTSPELERLAREGSERQRALELIARKRREMAGSETPSEMGRNTSYGDVFNRREVEEAHRGRGDPRDRGWDRGKRGSATGRDW